MAGAIIMVVLLVVAIPVGVLLGGMVGAVILGSTLKADGEANHEGSELIATNI